MFLSGSACGSPGEEHTLTRRRLAAMMEADQDGDGKLSFDEFKDMVASTDIAKQMVRARAGFRWRGGRFLIECSRNATFLSG